MGLFVRIEINDACRASEGCADCVTACPVDIFARDTTRIAVIEENEDECTLCDLCIQACPAEAITIVKLYEEA